MGRERQKQKNEEVRRAILDTAITIGIEEGFESLSIRKITNRLGYSGGIVYYYFENRQEIIDTIHMETNLFMKENINKVYKTDKGFEYNMRSVFYMILGFALEQPEKYNFIVREKYSKRGESIDLWVEMIENTIKVGLQNGDLRDMDSKTAALPIWSGTMGVIIMISGKKEIKKEEARKVLDDYIDILLMGMLKERSKK